MKMKNKIVVLVILVILPLIVISCSSKPEKEPDITGIIYSITEQSILVVEGVVDLNTSYDEWFEQGKLAISFTVNDKTIIKQEKQELTFNDLKEGQMVKVWSIGPLAESYPMQGTAREIIVLD